MTEKRRVASKKRLLEELEKTPIVGVACQRAGVPRSTYYRWRQESGSFEDECDMALARSAALISDLAESQLIALIKSGNLGAIIFWLKNHNEVYAEPKKRLRRRHFSSLRLGP